MQISGSEGRIAPGGTTESGDSRPRAPRLAYQPALDGLRGVAVGSVLLYHAGFSWMTGGYLGVSTFFTLSGYLITLLLLEEHRRTGKIHLAGFWEQRFRRILPAALAALLLIAAFAAIAADEYQVAHLRGDGLATLGYAVNWWFIATRREYADLFGSPSPVQHFWSLAIEEQFYLIFPLLTAGMLRLGNGSRRPFAGVLAILSLASVALMIALAPTNVPTARLYFGTDTRAAELLAGALLAIGLSSRPWRTTRLSNAVATALGVTALAVSAYFWTSVEQDEIRLYRGGLALYTLASTALVATAVAPHGIVRHALALAPLRWLGRISYGVYLYHFPIFLWLTAERTQLSDWPLFALRLGATLAVSLASFRWLEAPIRTGRRLRGRSRLVVPPVAMAAVALVLVAVAGERSQTLHVDRTAAVAGAVARKASGTRFMVVGDSVAHEIARGLERWATVNQYGSVLAHARSGCGIAQGGSESSRDARTRARACRRWVSGWRSQLAAFRPDVVVVYTGGWDLLPREFPEWHGERNIGDPEFDEWLESQFEAAVDTLAAQGARVVWLSSLCVRAPLIGTAGVFDPRRIQRLNEIIERLAQTKADRMTLIDLTADVCPRGEFSNTLNGIEGARPDGIHFSEPAADWLAGWLGPRILDETRRHPKSVASERG